MDKKIDFQPYQLEITDYDHQGRGIGRVEGKVCFAYDVFVGEIIEVTKHKVYKKYNYVERFRLIKSDEGRVEPLCGVFGRCGGCTLQHMLPEVQRKQKLALVTTQLQHEGLEVEAVKFEESQPYGYRRKARLSVRYNKRHEKIWFGFRHIHLPKVIVDIEKCPILVDVLSNGLALIKSTINSLSIPDAIPQVEVMECQGKAIANIRHLKSLTDNDISLLKDMAEKLGWFIFLQPKGEGSTYLLKGPENKTTFALQQKGYQVQVGVHDFMQINERVNEKLVDKALEVLDLSKCDAILDLFCGVGNFSLALGQRAGHVLGVEVNDEMIGKANNNAQINQMQNVDFIKKDLFEEVSLLKTSSFNKCLIDPPRSGALAVVEVVEPKQFEKIVYVSCNPQTFIRDAVILQSKGYRLSEVTLFDMFAQTKHTELLAVFTL